MLKYKVGQMVRVIDPETEEFILDILQQQLEEDGYVFNGEWVISEIDTEDEIYTCYCESIDGGAYVEADFVEDEIELVEQVDDLQFEVVDLQKADLTVDDFLDLVNLYDSLGDQESRQYYLDKLGSM